MEIKTKRCRFEVVLPTGKRQEIMASSYRVDRCGSLTFEELTYGVSKSRFNFLTPLPHWVKNVVSFSPEQWAMVTIMDREFPSDG